MNEQAIYDFKAIQSAYADVATAKLLAADRQTIIERLNAKLVSDGADAHSLFGLPCVLNAAIPQGEVWMVNAKTGELISRLTNVGE